MPAARVAPSMLWPVALGFFLYRGLLHPGRQPLGDLGPVWDGIRILATRGDIAASDLSYAPASVLLLAPIGFLGEGAAGVAFTVVNAAAMGIAILLAVECLGLGWRSAWGAAALLGTALSLALAVNADHHNVGGLVLLSETLATYLLWRGRGMLAGLVTGLGLALKPTLFVLVILLLAAWGWPALALAVATPLVLSAPVIAIDGHSAEYFSQRALEVVAGHHRFQAYNLGIQGLSAVGVPAAAAGVARVLVGAVAAAAAYVRWRAGGELGLRLVETNGIGMVGLLLSGPLAYPHHLLFVIPFAIAGARTDSVLRGPLAWTGVFLALADITWQSSALPAAVNTALWLMPGLGLALMLASTAAALVARARVN